MKFLLVGAFSIIIMLQTFNSVTVPICTTSAVDILSPDENHVNGSSEYHAVLATNDEAATRLFGMETTPVSIGELREKWRRVVATMARDFAVIAQCHTNGPCPMAAQRLIDLSAEGAGKNGRARVGLINRAANLAISPISDEKQWGVADHWSDPFETLLSYRGDCEDYAIVKYAALLEAGIPAHDVKIVILKNHFPDEYHAVAAARVNDEWLILDNRTHTLVRDTDITRATPVFVLDDKGVGRFNWASRTQRTVSRLSRRFGQLS
jgi:predicted transglutaminase-like cysteine proteinase